MAAFGKPISFDGLIREISSRYHLGPKGRSLVEEAVDMIAKHPGGISGFLDRFRDAGFTSEVSSWLAGTNPVPLSGLEIEQTLGADFINEVAKRAGVSQRFARTVLGYAIPKIIGMLAHSGFLDMALPPSALQAGEAPQHGEEQFPLGGTEEGSAAPRVTPRFSQMVIPAASLLVVLGLLGYFVSSGRLGHRGGATKPATVTAENAPAAAPPPPSKAATTEAENAPAAAPPAPSASAPQTAESAPAEAPAAPAASAPTEAENAPAEAPAAPAASAPTEAENAPSAAPPAPSQAAPAEAESARAAAPPAPSAPTPETAENAPATVPPAPSAPASGTKEEGAVASSEEPKSTVSVKGPISNPAEASLNLPTIYFAMNSTEVPPDSKAALEKAAAMIEQLPAGTVIHINGFTDSVGNKAVNLRLSQRRANAVRRVLIDAGVNPDKLIAKGYGETRGAMLQGRGHAGRRVEFQITQG